MNRVSTARQRFVRNFIIYLLFGLQMHLRKRKFAKPTNLHSSLVLSNVAITFLECLEFHSLNLNNSDLRENPPDISGKFQNHKICCDGSVCLSGEIKRFLQNRNAGKLKQRTDAGCADTFQAACVNMISHYNNYISGN